MTSDNSDTIFKQFHQKQTLTIESRARWTQKQDAQGLNSNKTLISGNQAEQGKTQKNKLKISKYKNRTNLTIEQWTGSDNNWQKTRP